MAKLPASNAVNLILGVAAKLRDVAVAHTKQLCVCLMKGCEMKGVPIAGMAAVADQISGNVSAATSFFSTLCARVAAFIEEEGKGGSTVEVCEHFLLLAPLLKVVNEYVREGMASEVQNPVSYTQLKTALVKTVSAVFSRELQTKTTQIQSRIVREAGSNEA